MKTACDLDWHALFGIVDDIQRFLFWDMDENGTEFWNSEKDFGSMSDLFNCAAISLERHDLIPETGPTADPMVEESHRNRAS